MYRDIRNLSEKRVREKVDQLLYSSNAYVPRVRIIILNYKKKKKFQSFPRYIEISTSIELSSIRVLTVFIRDKWGSAVFRYEPANFLGTTPGHHSVSFQIHLILPHCFHEISSFSNERPTFSTSSRRRRAAPRVEITPKASVVTSSLPLPRKRGPRISRDKAKFR